MKMTALYTGCGVAILLAAVLVLVPGDVRSESSDGEEEDQVSHEELFEYRQFQDILTFEDILKIIRSDIEGEVIEIEFEVEGGIAIYEIKFINPAGQVLEIFMDAKTGAFFEEEPE